MTSCLCHFRDVVCSNSILLTIPLFQVTSTSCLSGCWYFLFPLAAALEYSCLLKKFNPFVELTDTPTVGVGGDWASSYKQTQVNLRGWCEYLQLAFNSFLSFIFWRLPPNHHSRRFPEQSIYANTKKDQQIRVVFFSDALFLTNHYFSTI